MSTLDFDTITKLLKDETARGASIPKTGKPRPVQLGPLRWMEKDGRCASRGCSGPTFIQVEGVYRCATHALYALNYILIQIHSDYEEVSYTQNDCTCNGGKHSMMNIHGADCILYERIREHNANFRTRDIDEHSEYDINDNPTIGEL